MLTDVKAKEFKGCLLHLLTDGGKSIANNNEFTIKNGFFDSTVTGCEIKVVDFSNNSIGRSQPSKDYTISAEKNKLTLIDTTVQATVFGLDFCGYEVQPSKKTVITISGNVLTLKGGRYEGNIIGYSNSFFSKYASSENISIDIKNNTVAICKGTTMPEFSDSTIISGFSLGTQLESDGCFSRSDNTLEFHEVWGMTAGNIRNFTNIVFDLPDMKAGSAVMTLTRGATVDLDCTYLDVKVGNLTGADGGEFKIGEKIFLLKNSKGIAAGEFTVNLMPNKQGYLLDVKTDETSIYLTRIR